MQTWISNTQRCKNTHSTAFGKITQVLRRGWINESVHRVGQGSVDDGVETRDNKMLSKSMQTWIGDSPTSTNTRSTAFV